MPTKSVNHQQALYLSWRLPDDTGAVDRLQHRLSSVRFRKLFRLRSWVIVDGHAQALLAPVASLDRIADALWESEAEPVASRWVQGLACASVAREIETTPVSLGLAIRPEQWPWSSAADH